MRLYKRHDADLLCLYKQTNYSLPRTIKNAVLAYLNESGERIGYPDCRSDLSDLPSTAQFHLYLSSKSEDDVRIKKFIASLPAGFKNSFLKNITRYYLSKPCVFTIRKKEIILKAERDSSMDES